MTTVAAKDTHDSRRESPKHHASAFDTWGTGIVVFLAFLFFAARMFRLIIRYAVNIFFSDQWEFNDATLYQKHSIWEMFAWQHGPHRQGLGALFVKLIGPLIHWDSRVESFVVGAVVVIAALCALWLKHRLYGQLSIFDVVIPAMFFTPAQWETLVLTANFAHGPFPLLLLLLYCLAWTLKQPVLRYSIVLIINFLTIYTGFGLFLGVLTPLIFLAHFCASDAQSRMSKLALVVCIAISLTSLASFFVGYRLNADLDCFSIQPASTADGYLKYISLMYASFLSVRGVGPQQLTVGFAVVVFMLGSVTISLTRLFSVRDAGNDGIEQQRHLVTFILVAYVLLFCVNTAYGRLCGGLWSAQSSRYLIYLNLAMLGLYFQILGFRNRPRRVILLVGFVAVMFTASLTVDGRPVAFFHNVKARWKACYIQTENIQGCDQWAGFPLFSHAPERTRLQEKLNYLKQNRLNLYLNDH